MVVAKKMESKDEPLDVSKKIDDKIWYKFDVPKAKKQKNT